ncbi:MAG: type IV pilus biogenesis/stability protein PilW [Undibacterium sp.]|nr:type IV pilus biogenesis/stability protein PilW [Undibacterium sp.]
MVRQLLCVLIVGGLVACAGAGRTSKFTAEEEVDANAQSPDLQRRSAIHLQLAVEYFQQGQHKSALESIRQALLVSPNLADAFSLRGLVQMDQKDMVHAEENFLHALKLAPTNSEFAHNYGWFLCQNGREKQSLTYFDQALKDSSYVTPIKSMISAGVCSFRVKDLQGAERYFMLAFREQPNNPLVNAKLAQVNFEKSQFEKAKFYIQKLLKEEIFDADVLWLAIKINTKLGDKDTVSQLSTQLRRRHPNSNEYALLQRGAFNE